MFSMITKVKVLKGESAAHLFSSMLSPQAHGYTQHWSTIPTEFRVNKWNTIKSKISFPNSEFFHSTPPSRINKFFLIPHREPLPPIVVS